MKIKMNKLIFQTLKKGKIYLIYLQSNAILNLNSLCRGAGLGEGAPAVTYCYFSCVAL